MEKLGLNEIRRLFREFYESKEHYPAKSASLVPKNDKSLLLINSGMAPLKPYFAGLETPPAKRMVTCQKCIRTGDIENVGITSRHGTFFEMLGNFSFGDYFKEQSLRWGWEFITEILNMPTENVWATVYENDDQAVEIWKEIGMPEEKIVRLGKDDNFWEIGLGPCGPCSEIYFDRGEKFGCGSPDCKPGCECDRYVEFWNHVFTQFSKEEDGSYSDLAHPNIDTGMGLERLACIMQGVDSIFDIDTIRYILEGVTELAGIEYKNGEAETDISVRIITDHMRSMVFMIADGILPSNEGRGYVLRRLIRRAARHGKLLGIKEAFLSDLVKRVVYVSGDAYPEIREKQEYIEKIVSIEEEKFAETLGQGCEIIDGYIRKIESSDEKVLKGDLLFKVYDTYGFPPELTEEILSEKGIDADWEGFELCMKNQKEKARKGRKKEDVEGWKDVEAELDIDDTIFTGYTETATDSYIRAIISEGKIVDQLTEGETGSIYLEKTPFYAESGGQVYDKGIMSTDGAEAFVSEVTKNHGYFAHHIKVNKGTFTTGKKVSAKVDGIRRNHIRRNHTATHLLQAALKEVLGEHVSQAGSKNDDKTLRFDFTHFEAMTEAEIKKTEDRVNQVIFSFVPVKTEEMSLEDARKKGATALFDEKYGSTVRVVSAGDFSTELCGGTHVENTGEIGVFKIVSETGVASGVRRIEAVTGAEVLNIQKDNEKTLKSASEVLKTSPDGLCQKAESVMKELKAANKELDEIKKAAAGSEAENLAENAKNINGINLVTEKFEGADMNVLREISDNIKAEAKRTVMVLATVNEPKVNFLVSITDDLVQEGLHAGKMIKDIAKACGGGGGGKADMAQAGAKDSSKLENAFEVAESLLK